MRFLVYNVENGRKSVLTLYFSYDILCSRKPINGEFYPRIRLRNAKKEECMTSLVISGTAKSYIEKLNALDADKLAQVNQIREAILAKDKKVHERISKKCATFNLGRKTVAKISINGKCIRVHLALDPGDERFATYPLKDLSEKTSYKDVPAMIKISSDLAFRRALKLIAAL